MAHTLTGIIEMPDQPLAYAMFSHCFTCTKDLKAIVRISRNLAQQGIAVLRFDFTGLGDSRGDFSETNLDTNVADLASAARFLRDHYRPPQLLIGHSLGGAAIMKHCMNMPSVEAIATIASPSSTRHLADFLSQINPAIVAAGRGEVSIGGRNYQIKKQLLDNLLSHDLESDVSAIRIPHLIFHPPGDETLPFWHAERLFELTGGPKSMITLDGSDHLLVNNPHDVQYVAEMIAGWYGRIRAVTNGGP